MLSKKVKCPTQQLLSKNVPEMYLHLKIVKSTVNNISVLITRVTKKRKIVRIIRRVLYKRKCRPRPSGRVSEVTMIDGQEIT